MTQHTCVVGQFAAPVHVYVSPWALAQAVGLVQRLSPFAAPPAQQISGDRHEPALPHTMGVAETPPSTFEALPLLPELELLASPPLLPLEPLPVAAPEPLLPLEPLAVAAPELLLPLLLLLAPASVPTTTTSRDDRSPHAAVGTATRIHGISDQARDRRFMAHLHDQEAP